MKFTKIALIILSFFLTIASSSQAAEKIYKKEEVVKRDGYTYDKKTNELVTGFVQIYYESGGMSGKIPLKDGLPDGVAQYYDRSGLLMEERVYKNGKKHGVDRGYDDGKIISEFTYGNNRLITGFFYSKNGEKEKISDVMIQDYNSSLPESLESKEAEVAKKIEEAMKTLEKPSVDSSMAMEERYKIMIEFYSKAFKHAGYGYFDTINKVADDLKSHRDRVPKNGESRHKMIIMMMALQKKDCQYYKVDCIKLYPPETRESITWLYENSGWSF